MRDVGFRMFVEKVKAASDIRQIIGERIQLDRSSKALCPFHDDHNPSLSINVAGQYFYCFGCHAGGDVFSFLMRYEGKSFEAAVRELAQDAGIPIPKSFRKE